MQRLFSPILAVLLVASCETWGQNDNGTHRSLRIFKEATDSMMVGVRVEHTDPESSRRYYLVAIEKYDSAYRIGNDVELGLYLSYLYYKVQQFDSALAWGLRHLPIDSMRESKDMPKAYASKLNKIGLLYINTGDVKSAENYFIRSFAFDSSRVGLIQELSFIADDIYQKKKPRHIAELRKRRINPCNLSVEILRLGRRLAGDDKYIKEYLISLDRIERRRKRCM